MFQNPSRSQVKGKLHDIERKKRENVEDLWRNFPVLSCGAVILFGEPY